MRDIIIDTEAKIRFDDAVDAAFGSDKALSGFILAYGQAGRGKSVAADGYHISRNAGAYVRVWQNWSQSAFLQRLLFEVRGSNEDMPRYNGNRCKEIVVHLLQNKRQPLFIDEADRLKVDRIEDLRDIYEMTGVPVVLIGEEGLLGLLAERRRIWSRVVYDIEFGPINAIEVATYGQQAAGLKIQPDLCGRIAEKSEGDFRLVRNMMLLLEKAAKAAGTMQVDSPMLDTVFSSRSWRRK
ncbi:MAG: ATP-binding protein [Desulfarculales bacterium]|jgi:DNA transposition AAA+ family ATPase|nr:ATP-binding protein [Desulfarculales bacterium]